MGSLKEPQSQQRVSSSSSSISSSSIIIRSTSCWTGFSNVEEEQTKVSRTHNQD